MGKSRSICGSPTSCTLLLGCWQFGHSAVGKVDSTNRYGGFTCRLREIREIADRQ